MKQRQQISRAAAATASTAKEGSTAHQGASPNNIQSQNGPERKPLPVPIDVAFKHVRRDSQIADVMACLTSTTEFVDMPTLSRRSGSLTIHSAIAQIRRRFHWVIENEMQRCGLEWHSKYRLISPPPASGQAADSPECGFS
jgi:hypothetical protein